MMDISEEGFWETLHLLIEYKKTGRDVRDEVDDWVNKVIARKKGLNEILEDEDISIASNGTFRSEFSRQEEIKKFQKDVNLPPIICRLRYPIGKSRVEKLMGSNLVSLTDRNYMQKLQRRIVEDYTENMTKRISTRQAEELERVKNLVLVGKIPLEKAPIEMANHPVMLIEKYFNPKEFSTRKDSKTKRLKLTNRSSSIETLPILESTHCEKIDISSPIENNLVEDTDEEEAHFETEGIELVKYENPLIKELKNCETVQEMYSLADAIIGKIKPEHGKPDEILQLTEKNL